MFKFEQHDCKCQFAEKMKRAYCIDMWGAGIYFKMACWMIHYVLRDESIY